MEQHRCDYVSCPRTATWSVSWERYAQGAMVQDTTRECGTHVLADGWDNGLGVPIAVAAL